MKTIHRKRSHKRKDTYRLDWKMAFAWLAVALICVIFWGAVTILLFSLLIGGF